MTGRKMNKLRATAWLKNLGWGVVDWGFGNGRDKVVKPRWVCPHAGRSGGGDKMSNSLCLCVGQLLFHFTVDCWSHTQVLYMADNFFCSQKYMQVSYNRNMRVCVCCRQTTPIFASLNVDTFSAEVWENRVTNGFSLQITFVSNWTIFCSFVLRQKEVFLIKSSSTLPPVQFEYRHHHHHSVIALCLLLNKRNRNSCKYCY